MADKAHILTEIRRTAKENGGKPLGGKRFAKETGIREWDWRGRYWPRWSDAVTEAGFEPNTFSRDADDASTIEQLTLETRRLGHFPTDAERILRRRGDDSFPSEKVFRRLGYKRDLVRSVADYCRERPAFADVLEIVEPLLALDEEPAGAAERVEYGFV